MTVLLAGGAGFTSSTVVETLPEMGRFVEVQRNPWSGFGTSLALGPDAKSTWSNDHCSPVRLDGIHTAFGVEPCVGFDLGVGDYIGWTKQEVAGCETRG